MIDEVRTNVAYHFIEVCEVLTHYRAIDDGENVCLQVSNNQRSSRDIFNSPFELQSCLKADIDTAIDSMGPENRWLDFSKDIYQKPHNLTPRQQSILKYILDPSPSLFHTITKAAWDITDYLNGKSDGETN